MGKKKKKKNDNNNKSHVSLYLRICPILLCTLGALLVLCLCFSPLVVSMT